MQRVMLAPLLLCTALAVGSLGGPGGDSSKEPEREGILPERIARLPFLPSSVLRDDSSLYILGSAETQLARLDLKAKERTFEAIDVGDIGTGAALTVHDGLIYLAKRSAHEVVVFDVQGKVKRRFGVARAPSALAVDDLGAVHIFSVFPSQDDPKGLLEVYDRNGSRIRMVGELPRNDELPILVRRAQALPMLRTDSLGGVWALVQNGKTAIRVGITRAGADVFALDVAAGGSQGGENASTRQADPSADRLGQSQAEQDAQRERETLVREKLVEDLKKRGIDKDNPNVRIVTVKNEPSPFRDFACNSHRCLAVYRESLETQARHTTVARFLMFDRRSSVEAVRSTLDGQPEAILGVIVDHENFYLYAARGAELLEYRLTDF